jgi:hypothetical protein
MASISHSYFPQWSSPVHSRSVRHTLTIALVATTVGMTAGASAIAFLITSPIMGPNLSLSSSRSSTGPDRPIADESNLEAAKLAIAKAAPLVVENKSRLTSATPIELSVAQQPASAGETSVSAAVSSSDHEAQRPKKHTKFAMRDHAHSVVHTRKSYRSRFGGFFFPNRNRRWFSARARYQSNLSPL